jgi:hypothetical protein
MTSDFVDGMVEWISGVPLLVVATARPESLNAAPVGREETQRCRSAAPLSDEETSAAPGVVRGLIAGDRNEATLLANAGGNLLYTSNTCECWANVVLLVSPPEIIQE